MKQLYFCIIWLWFLHGMGAAQPPLLKGEVKYLNGNVVANASLKLLEPGVNGTTDPDGVFKIRLPAGWHVGDPVTLKIQLKGYEILRPWNAKITIQAAAAKKLEPIIVAKQEHVRFLKSQELERFLQARTEAEVRSRTEPETSPELIVLSEEARRLKMKPEELIALLNEWKTQVEARGTFYEKALAALYEKKYAEAIELLTNDIAQDEKEITRSDSLKALLPRKYLNRGLAYVGNYEHANAEKDFKKALALDPDFSFARILLADTYDFTGRLSEALSLLRLEAKRHVEMTDSTQKGLYSDILNRIGNVYQTQGKLDSALIVYRQALEINRQLQ
ncbi:tetratricopeptide repeat protein, partial [candidate division KSB1 bacterium]|nr:tetratricopeptide repeat protein [candidate division KSB1 bacterium]